jgi:hypothetical protein
VSKRKAILGFVLPAVLAAGLLMYYISGRAVHIDKYSNADRQARIYPDYGSTVIPPDIAPLNFMVQEDGSYYLARIYCDKGEAIEVSGRSPKIMIHAGRWHELLDKNRGGQLKFDIFVRVDNKLWVKYRTITNNIARENIDSYLVYRRMHPPFNYPKRGPIGIFERNLKSFDEKLLLDNHRQPIGCINCHTFWDKQPDKALLGVRNSKYGATTLLMEGKTIRKIDRKLGYTTWHPSGRLAVFSNDTLPVMFHTARDIIYETVDMNSSLAYLVTDSNTVKTSPELSRSDRLETWPVWSADGRCLYYCSALKLWTDEAKMPPDGYDKIKYDLVRISYDVNSDKWGEAETVISSKDTGLSIAMPRTSPDGRWLTFCMQNYGFFPPWHQSSDLYIVDLKAAQETGRFEYRRLNINSDKSESWQSWSRNSRWIVFSSKRADGGFTRSYLSYIDEKGEAHKPMIVPQKDPAYYSYSMEAFNTPELTAGPILVDAEQLEKAVLRGPMEIIVKIPTKPAAPDGANPVPGQVE